MIQDVLIYFVTSEVLGEEILVRSDKSQECFDMIQAVMHVYTVSTGLDLFFYRMKKGGPYSADVEAHIREIILPQIYAPEGLTMFRRTFTELGKARIRLVKNYLDYDEACGIGKAQFYSLLSSMLYGQEGHADKQWSSSNVLTCVGRADESLSDFIDRYWNRVEIFLKGKRNLPRSQKIKQVH